MSVYESLDRLERLYHQLKRAALPDGIPDGLEILALRQKFAAEYGSFTLALNDDLDAAEHSELNDELQDRIGTLRIRLMSHTMRWQPPQIEADPEGYRVAAEAIAELVRQFIQTTRGRLEKAGVA